ncbi:predicted protein [Postia placenta Mad-698-R]|nr:predicted protein [Postia placenta Mad-698-R]
MLFEIDDRSTVQTFTLNTSGRIEALERELLQLRKRREVFDGVEILQRKKPTTPVVTRSAEASGSGTSKGVAAPSSTSTSTAPPPTIPAAAPAPSSSPPTQSTTTSAPPAPPVHPFANARDATYAPPNVRNFATPPKPSNDKGKEPAYKTIVPVIQPKLAEEIFQRSMKSQFVTLTPEELLSIAPDVRTKYRDAVTPKRVSTEPVASAHIVEIGADEVTAVNQLSCSGATLEPGATIVPDPYETYLKHIPHGEHPAEFTVARDSNAIRSIIALVDNKEQIECIVDPGSQIVAMSEEVCLGLNLLFDPTIQLNMQSANGEVDRSLGLIRNVTFRIGEIVLYLQAHVIRNTAYDILLGRPFDVLTQSVVKNFADENQTITILCPNTGETVTIPTPFFLATNISIFPSMSFDHVTTYFEHAKGHLLDSTIDAIFYDMKTTTLQYDPRHRLVIVDSPAHEPDSPLRERGLLHLLEVEVHVVEERSTARDEGALLADDADDPPRFVVEVERIEVILFKAQAAGPIERQSKQGARRLVDSVLLRTTRVRDRRPRRGRPNY